MVTFAQYIYDKFKISIEIEEIGERLEIPKWLNINNIGWFHKKVYGIGEDYIAVEIRIILLHPRYFVVGCIEISSQSW